jgi:hypothetical protein
MLLFSLSNSEKFFFVFLSVVQIFGHTARYNKTIKNSKTQKQKSKQKGEQTQ